MDPCLCICLQDTLRWWSWHWCLWWSSHCSSWTTLPRRNTSSKWVRYLIICLSRGVGKMRPVFFWYLILMYISCCVPFILYFLTFTLNRWWNRHDISITRFENLNFVHYITELICEQNDFKMFMLLEITALLVVFTKIQRLVGGAFWKICHSHGHWRILF